MPSVTKPAVVVTYSHIELADLLAAQAREDAGIIGGTATVIISQESNVTRRLGHVLHKATVTIIGGFNAQDNPNRQVELSSLRFPADSEY